MKPQTISGWGRHPVTTGTLVSPHDDADLISQISASDAPIAPRGNGRSYGDASFNQNGAMTSLKLDRMISFDAEAGTFTCEAGVLLRDVLKVVLPQGWFVPVSPGTKFVTVGGMVAADVHGKNAVRDGTFGQYVDWIELVHPNGDVVRCSRRKHKQLFLATIGGMGLTGFIAHVQFRLSPVETGWMKQDRLIAKNLTQLLEQFELSEDAKYRVAWIDVLQSGDSLGRSLLDIGEHATLEELGPKQAEDRFALKPGLTKSVPFTPPISPLNRFSVKAFNAVYYRAGKGKEGESFVGWDTYFYPLDNLLNWNRIYGRRGFAQYQCVIPREAGFEGMTELLKEISASGAGSFLAVLKRLGDSEGLLSFPMDGYTLALDFPWNQKVAKLLLRLDEIVLAHGGRIYLAKDSRLPRDTFAQMQDQLPAFETVREKWDTRGHFETLLSERLSL